MKTGVIKGADQMSVFAPLLLPHVREAMKRGEPVRRRSEKREVTGRKQIKRT